MKVGAQDNVEVEVEAAPNERVAEEAVDRNMANAGGDKRTENGCSVDGSKPSGNGQPIKDDKAQGAQDGLGPWMLVSYRRKPSKPMMERRNNKGLKEPDNEGQWKPQHNRKVDGSGGKLTGGNKYSKADLAKGKEKAEASQWPSGQRRSSRLLQQASSKNGGGQSSKGGLETINTGSTSSPLHGTVLCNPLFSPGESFSPGVGQEEPVGKRVAKRKKHISNDGGDASPMGS